MVKKVLFVDMHRQNRSPSQRFRYEQYLRFLTNKGIEWEHSNLLNENDDHHFYQPGNYLKKLQILIKSIRKRLADIDKAQGDVDVVYIQREAFLLGSTYFERQFANSKAKVIFDFDDSIWLNQVSKSSAPNKNFSWLKNPSKTATIIKLANHVIAGNQYLADYALQYNNRVSIIPTTIDTELYLEKSEKEYKKDRICIGWSGSKTTLDHFEEALPVLKELKKHFGDKISFKVIGSGNYVQRELGIQGKEWNAEDEINELREIDIGIMPLPDDEWSKGKCGLKGLQYMALGIPTVMSPVGVNKDIIDDGVNGFSPKSQKDWVATICNLVEDEALRQRIGKKARQTVVDYYSMESQKEQFLKILTE